MTHVEDQLREAWRSTVPPWHRPPDRRPRCIGCGKVLPKASRRQCGKPECVRAYENDRRRRNRREKWKFPPIKCAHCGKLVRRPTYNRKYCGAVCRNIVNHRRERSFLPADTLICEICGKEAPRIRRRQMRCSRRCSKIARARIWREGQKKEKPMGQLILVQRPAQDVVGVTEAKSQLHVDTAADDAKLAALLLAATQRMDGAAGVLGRALIQQTWQLQLSDWPAGAIEIPLPPLIGVTRVAYLDGSGAEQTLDPSLYRVVSGGDGRPARIVRAIGATWPSAAVGQPDAVRVTFDAGYVDAASPSNNAVPEPIRQAIILLADEFYNRGSTNDIPEVVQSLIAPFKIERLGAMQYAREDERGQVDDAACDHIGVYFRG